MPALQAANGYVFSRRGAVDRQEVLRDVGPVRTLHRHLSGGRASPQTHATGTTGAYSTMAGRRVRVLPLMAAIARLPKVKWMAPPSTVSDLTWLLTIFTATGKPVPALSSGNAWSRVQGPARGDRRLGDVGQADCLDDLLAHQALLHAGHRQQRQDRDHGDDYHQFDQREASHGPTGAASNTSFGANFTSVCACSSVPCSQASTSANSIGTTLRLSC